MVVLGGESFFGVCVPVDYLLGYFLEVEVGVLGVVGGAGYQGSGCLGDGDYFLGGVPCDVCVAGFFGGGVGGSYCEGGVGECGYVGVLGGELGVVDVVCAVCGGSVWFYYDVVVVPWPGCVGEFVFDDFLGYVFGDEGVGWCVGGLVSHWWISWIVCWGL